MSEATSVRSLITPQDQTLRTVFNAQRSYFIDIYQREYKWTEENVRNQKRTEVGAEVAEGSEPCLHSLNF